MQDGFMLQLRNDRTDRTADFFLSFFGELSLSMLFLVVWVGRVFWDKVTMDILHQDDDQENLLRFLSLCLVS